MSTRKAVIMMSLSSVMWSIAGVIFKYIECNPFVIAGIRSFIASMTVLVYMIVTKQRFMVTKRTLLNAVFLAAVFFCFVGSNKLTSAANAIVLQYTAPVFVLLYQLIFKRMKPHIHDIICVVLTFFGIALFFGDSIGEGRLIGDIVAIASGFFFGGMMIAIGESDPCESINGVFQGQLLTALIGIPFVFFTENTFTPTTVGLFLVLGIIQLGIPYTVVAIAGPHCPPLASSLVTVFEPLLNPVWVALIYHEVPGVWALVGGVIVIANVLTWCIMRDKREERQKVKQQA